MPVTISELWTYPIKSCRGTRHDKIRTTARGLRGDRDWMVVDAQTGRFITQRDDGAGRLATVQARPTFTGDVIVSAPGMPNLTIIRPGDDMARPSRRVTVWGDTVDAEDAGGAVADWFSKFMARNVRVVYMAPGVRRPADPQYASGSDVSFTDGFQVLVTCEASLAALGLPPEAMGRFRPNIVLKGLRPFEEDAIAVLQIGNTMFELVKPCTRCRVPAIDQLTGIYDKASNPLPALRDGRTGQGAGLKGLFFGQNARPTMYGASIKTGDEVQVISRHAPHPAVQSCKLHFTV